MAFINMLAALRWGRSYVIGGYQGFRSREVPQQQGFEESAVTATSRRPPADGYARQRLLLPPHRRTLARYPSEGQVRQCL